MLLLLSGDAVRPYRRERLHTRLSVPIFSFTGFRGGASKRDTKIEMSYRRHLQQATAFLWVLQPMRSVERLGLIYCYNWCEISSYCLYSAKERARIKETFP